MKPDTQLYDDIRKKLEFEQGIDPSQITFCVQNGIAILSGKVSNYNEKILIKNAIWQIRGIKAIVDDISINPRTSEYSDIEIATLVVNALELDPSLPKNEIKVSVERGSVTLSGVLPWYYQKQNAEYAVRYLAGISNIDNQIVV